MWFTKIKTFYQRGLWTLQQVADAVTAGKITVEQYTEITGETL